MSDFSNTKKWQENKNRQVSFFVKYMFQILFANILTVLFSKFLHKFRRGPLLFIFCLPCEKIFFKAHVSCVCVDEPV